MKKPSMTQGTKAHSSAVKMKAEQNAAMKMKKEAAMKMAANQQPMQAPAQPVAAPQQPAQQPMQQPAPTMMKKESPTKMKKMTGNVDTSGKSLGKKKKNLVTPELLAEMGKVRTIGRIGNVDDSTKNKLKKKKSPAKSKEAAEGRANVERYAKGKKHVGTKRTPEQLRRLAARAEKAGSTDAAKKMRAKAGRAEAEKGRAADYLKKNSPDAMKKAPLKKPLVGKQKNLPEEIKKKILAAPTKMKKASPAKADWWEKAKDRVKNIGAAAKEFTQPHTSAKDIQAAYLKSKSKTDKKYKKKK